MDRERVGWGARTPRSALCGSGLWWWSAAVPRRDGSHCTALHFALALCSPSARLFGTVLVASNSRGHGWPLAAGGEANELSARGWRGGRGGPCATRGAVASQWWADGVSTGASLQRAAGRGSARVGCARRRSYYTTETNQYTVRTPLERAGRARRRLRSHAVLAFTLVRVRASKISALRVAVEDDDGTADYWPAGEEGASSRTFCVAVSVCHCMWTVVFEFCWHFGNVKKNRDYLFWSKV